MPTPKIKCLHCGEDCINDLTVWEGEGYTHTKCHSEYLLRNRTKNESPFAKIMNECIALHDKKSHDYASTNNRFSNFEFAASLIKSFTNSIDQVFVCMIGIKLARLSELRNGKEPNNESIRDSHLDLVTYCGLWASYYDSIAHFICSACKISFKYEEALVKHVIEYHTLQEVAIAKNETDFNKLGNE